MRLVKNIRTIGIPQIGDGIHDVILGSGKVSQFDGGTADSSFEQVIDGRELVLSPGFIDMHSHSDLYRFRKGTNGLALGDFPKLTQGCTFQVMGQDGYSAAPVRRDDKSDYSQFISGLDGSLPPDEWKWESFGDYMTANSGIPGTRTAHLVGHSTIRRHAAGMDNRLLTSRELDEMKHLLRESLISGAVGMSTGLVYAPASYSNAAELYELATVLAEFDSVMFVHLRSESNRVLEAFEEVADACDEAGCRLHISHIKTAGADNWHLTPALINSISRYVNERNLRITADLHPYVAGSTMASVFLPGWFQDGDIEETLRRLRDPASIEKARVQILNDVDSWDNWWRFSSGWPGIRFTECQDKSLIGIPLDELIKSRGFEDIHSYEAFEWFFSVLANSRMQASIISFNNTESNISEFLKLPFISLCTDGLINPHGRPHPRTYGSFPRLFSRFVRELGVIEMEQAVRVCAVNGRSVIRDTEFNDFVIFDPRAINDTATFDSPTDLSTGIIYEYINNQWIDIPHIGSDNS
ncbi:unannotated protein [freshwater metagenome]|uniref:Unannotated protein n=1 Tax=freshwater metagenome TaxID=449393 RepID=A0A6J6HBZ9_9ZZZZ|nr:amidohydrolase family protein [Actinomycetota bacterium]